MQPKILCLAALGLLAACSAPPSSDPAPEALNQLPTVVSITGGQTLVVRDRGRDVATTLACIAVPAQPAAATDRLTSLLPAGQAVQMRPVAERDGQTVAELFLGNRSVGLELVQAGVAMVEPSATADCADAAEGYWQAQIEAQQNRRGLWADYDLAISAPIDLEPNLSLPVQADSGQCPESVDLWAFRNGFEGGANHIVVVDLPQIATAPAEPTAAIAGQVVFTAPLRSQFSQCSGSATAEQMAMYQAEFADGQVRFTLNLTGDGTREVLASGVSVDRPYAFWRAAE
ncbi:thermonuclease family protein [Nodosilinea sp. PGN35]|uniref:thermonuclease family protein n=1 Tax=Nodosilinea sp. PGN35 TaxID=3020489 RepID=UPI0023B353D7|nr:thermonuclease family protein [Nodosilinea sp. TSF1-S3]MDF0365664.1 thermonuclease family protein [Nodosilinea sp. TSF1-S3]